MSVPKRSPLIFKIVPAALWQQAEASGRFTGAPVDAADGYIHFSTSQQAAETAAKHFHGQRDLLLVAVRCDAFPADTLRWEPSRGGHLFPHLYSDLPLDAVTWVRPLPLAEDGTHLFPDLEGETL